MSGGACALCGAFQDDDAECRGCDALDAEPAANCERCSEYLSEEEGSRVGAAVSLRSAWKRHEWLGKDDRMAFTLGYRIGREEGLAAGLRSCKKAHGQASANRRAERQRSELTPAERKRLVGPYDPDAALSAGGET